MALSLTVKSKDEVLVKSRHPLLVSSPRKGNPLMIASEVQQRIDQLADQLQNIRGYL
jgi:hypothetical protein